MAPPVFLTTGPTVPPPPSPSAAREYEQWVKDNFDEALFETQQGRLLRFVRTKRQGGTSVAIVLASSRDEPTATDEVVVPTAALGDTSVPPCLAKVYLFIFNTSVRGTNGEVMAKRTKAEGGSITKIVVMRAPAEGSETARATQSTLTASSFLTQVARELSHTSIHLPAVAGPGETGGTATEVVSWAALPKLADLARAAEVFTSAEPSLPWAAAEEFLSAALRTPVLGKTAVIAAAAKLNSKLTARTAVRTAVASALDVARETCVTLTMRDKGEIVATQGVPSSAASPAARAPPAPAEAGQALRQVQGAQAADAVDTQGDTGSDGSVSSSSSSSSSSDTASSRGSSARKKRGRKHSKRSKHRKSRKSRKSRDHKKRSRKRRRELPEEQEAFSPAVDLARLTPAGMRASQVAKVLFGNPTLSKAAQYEEYEPESGSDDEEVAERRTAFAVRRLTELCGKGWIPMAPVSSKRELRQVREHAVHMVASRSAGVKAGHARDQPVRSHDAGPSSSLAHAIDVDAEERTVTLSTGATALASEHKVGAVLPDVVERLHEGSTRLAYEQGADVGAGIRSAPEDLRADLARAVGSNGRVDAAGERKSTRCTMPSVVVRMSSTLVDEVNEALRKLPTEDESGCQHMYMKSARKLSEAAVSGHFHMADYTKELKHVLGTRNAPKSGSLQELKYTWRYIRVALLTTASALYGMRGTDAGLTKVDNRVGATAATLRLDAFEVRAWLRRVLESWESAVTRFRRGAHDMPSFESCVSAHDEYFKFASITASIALRAESGGHRRDSRQRGSRSSRDDDGETQARRGHASDESQDDDDDEGGGRPAKASKTPRGGRKGKGSKGDAAGRTAGDDRVGQSTGRRNAKPFTAISAWPNKPRMSAEQFDAFKAEVREKCADTCNFFLITSCRKEKCSYSHEIPAAFQAIKAKYSTA